MEKLSTLSLVALLFFIFGFGLIVFALIRKIAGIRAAKKMENFRFRQGTQVLLPLISGVAFIAISQGLFWLSSQRSNFRSVTFDSPQAEVDIRQTKEETFYIDFKEGEGAAPIKIPYLKPNVKIVTQVIVWKPFFSFLGPLNTAKVTRIEFTDEQGGMYVFNNSDQAAGFADWLKDANRFFPMALVRTLETHPQVLAAGRKYRLFVTSGEAQLKPI